MNAPYAIADDVNPERTLVMIPCSGRKSAGVVSGEGRRLTSELPAELAQQLIAARRELAPAISLDENSSCAAWKRYEGSFYIAARNGLEIALRAQFPVLIITGGYGLVWAEERIGTYEKIFKPQDWPNNVLQQAIASIIRGRNIRTLRAFASASTGYAKLVKSVPWRACGVIDAWLLSPEGTTGAMVKSPRAQGEAFTAMIHGTLDDSWRSSDGLMINPTKL